MLFAILFILFCVGVGVIAAWGVENGEVDRIIYGHDSFGNICGQDNSARIDNYNSGLDMTGYTSVVYVSTKCVCVLAAPTPPHPAHTAHRTPHTYNARMPGCHARVLPPTPELLRAQIGPSPPHAPPAPALVRRCAMRRACVKPVHLDTLHSFARLGVPACARARARLCVLPCARGVCPRAGGRLHLCVKECPSTQATAALDFGTWGSKTWETAGYASCGFDSKATAACRSAGMCLHNNTANSPYQGYQYSYNGTDRPVCLPCNLLDRTPALMSTPP